VESQKYNLIFDWLANFSRSALLDGDAKDDGRTVATLILPGFCSSLNYKSPCCSNKDIVNIPLCG
jgi:hypothetical protein